MKTRTYLSIALILSLAISSCQKDGSTSGPSQKTDTTATVTNKTTDVYAVGYTVAAGDAQYSTAVLWKNNVATPLSTTYSDAYGIAIQGTDVYIVGDDSNNNTGQACYWKNGTRVFLSAPGSTGSYATGILVQGNDIYITGSAASNQEGYVAVYWKNGVMVKLSSTGGFASATSIAVTGNDVYVSGYHGQTFACYWKNGIITELNGNAIYTYAFGIAINNNDVYVTGQSSGIANPSTPTGLFAISWKNGISSKVAPTETISGANAILFIGNDQYIAGSVENGPNDDRATYWKNGVSNPVSEYSQASSIAVQGTDVYLGGATLSLFTDTTVKSTTVKSSAAYWKNGQIVKLNTTLESYVTGIAVVQK